jgi:DNA replication protein DnaC
MHKHENRIALILRGCGMRQHEIDDSRLPALGVRLDGDNGCGLVGDTGTGKTAAMARHLRRWVTALVERAENPEAAVAPFNFAVWANWPTAAEKIKQLSTGDSYALGLMIEDMATCGILYLDDLGAERVRGEDDLALGHLRVILDERYRNGRPLFWTSNLQPEEMDRVYGARTMSRLLSAWPPKRVEGKDLRFRRPGVA